MSGGRSSTGVRCRLEQIRVGGQPVPSDLTTGRQCKGTSLAVLPKLQLLGSEGRVVELVEGVRGVDSPRRGDQSVVLGVLADVRAVHQSLNAELGERSAVTNTGEHH